MLVLSIPFIAPVPITAQAALVAVSGRVGDASGASLSGATVEAVAAGRSVATAVTGDDGRYRLEVPRGVPFELRVRREGFAEYAAGIRGSATGLALDVTLQIGRVSDTLVVTASRGAEDRATITSSVTVMTEADVHAVGAAQLSDVLRFVPGVALDGTGREGGVTTMFARGGESNYNLVLVDGVRANVQGGGFDFSRIGAREIERVEVVRGAQSSLWGSDAMGAVVQVFTRRAGAGDAPRVSGSIEAGTFETWRTDAHVTGGAGRRVDYRAGVNLRRTDGAFAEILPETDRYEGTAVHAGGGVTLGSGASLRTAVRYSHDEGRNAGFISFGDRNRGAIYDTEHASWTTDLSHTAGARFTGTATVNYFRYEAVSADTIADPPFTTYTVLEGTPDALFPDGVRLVRVIDEAEFDALVAAGAAPGPGRFLASAMNFGFTYNEAHEPTIFHRPAVRYQGDYTWRPGARLSAGYEWERESFSFLDSDPTTTGFGLDNHAFFIQQQAAFGDRLFVTAGARVDSRERYDTFVSPKLSAGGFLVPLRPGRVSSLKVFGNIGKGIKSPTFGERFGGAFADPNPDLAVERARASDIGVEATFASERVRAVATYFNNDYVDQIAYRFGPVGDGIPENINIDGSEADGWELELALQKPAGGFIAAASYSFVDTRVVTNLSTSQQFLPGQALLRRPKHSGTVRGSYTAGPVTVSGDVRVVGDRHDNSFLFLQTVPNAQYPSSFTTDITLNPGYAVAGLGVDYRVDRTFTLYLRGNNIGDTTYDSALGYPGLPRSVVVGAMVDVGR
jgi:outer membrane cobalamin receptor